MLAPGLSPRLERPERRTSLQPERPESRPLEALEPRGPAPVRSRGLEPLVDRMVALEPQPQVWRSE